MREENHNKTCSHCGAPTSFERHSVDEPPEGEICAACEDWVCVDCVTYADTTPICKQCIADEHELLKTATHRSNEK